MVTTLIVIGIAVGVWAVYTFIVTMRENARERRRRFPDLTPDEQTVIYPEQTPAPEPVDSADVWAQWNRDHR